MTGHLLITGGAGYIGSVTARHLHALGWRITTLDDLSTGHRWAAQGRLVEGDLRNEAPLNDAFQGGVDAVLHFASRSLVSASVDDPLATWGCNLGGTLALLDAMRRHGCAHLVMSSSCAVYGRPRMVPIGEDTPHAPVSPYGATKAAIERLIADVVTTGQLRAVSLRYFNAAGATADATLGEHHDPETHLIPLALDAARTGTPITVFGTDHPTPDGTCVRDYVHVEDLAHAHALALEALLEGRSAPAYNLGSSVGHSVMEVIDTVLTHTGHPCPWLPGPRREGDPPVLVADASLAHRDLGWHPTRDLERMVADAWRWMRRGPRT